jgi:putative heme transporter
MAATTPTQRTVLRSAVVAGLLVVAAILLWDKLPSATAVGDVLHTAEPVWLATAAFAEVVSMAMFARQQRRLLTAFGVTMPLHRALALAYSRSAIAISLPAGSAISAAYAFRQFRTDGASKRAAATVMVLSGLLSVAALALLYGTGVVAATAVEVGRAWQEQSGSARGSVLLAAALVLFVCLFAWQSSGGLETGHRAPRRPLLSRIEPRWPRVARTLAPVADAISSSRSVPGRQWGLALSAALTNWLTDLLCLYAVSRAFDLPVGLVEVGAIYLTVQIVRQIPLTPGGIGVIEVSLLAGLLSAGAGEAAAAATVLGYRLLSCWLIIPVGLLCWLGLRHHAPERQPAETH